MLFCVFVISLLEELGVQFALPLLSLVYRLRCLLVIGFVLLFS